MHGISSSKKDFLACLRARENTPRRISSPLLNWKKTLTCIPFGSQLRSEVERHSTNLKSGDGNKKVDSKDIQILEINQAIKASESHLQQPLVKVHSLNLT